MALGHEYRFGRGGMRVKEWRCVWPGCKEITKDYIRSRCSVHNVEMKRTR